MILHRVVSEELLARTEVQANSKHCFTTSFLWRKVPESDAQSVRSKVRVGMGRLYLTLHSHRVNDFCIKMGSNDSHFNVSLIVRGKVPSLSRKSLLFFFKKKESRSRIEPRSLSFTSLPARPNGSPERN